MNSARRHTTCLFEVLMAGLMVDLGIRFMVSPEILRASNMGVLAVSMGVNFVASACFIIGLARAGIMFFENHFYPWGIHVRFGITILSGLIWTIMLSGFLETFLIRGIPLPPGFDMLLAQAIGELVVALQLSREMP